MNPNTDTEQQKPRRWVITHIDDSTGFRMLSLGHARRWNYVDELSAQLALAAWTGPQGLPRVLTAAEMATVELRQVECWPMRDGTVGDPVGLWIAV